MDKTFWRATLNRAIRTICQTAVAMIGTGQVGLLDIAWANVLSVSAVAGILSVLMSIATGLPEVEAADLLGTRMQTLYDEYDDFEFEEIQKEKESESEVQ